MFGRFFVFSFVHVPYMAHLSGYGDVVEHGNEDENGCSDEQGGEECCRLESVVEVAQEDLNSLGFEWLLIRCCAACSL